MSGHYVFREVQRWRDVWWVMVLVFGLSALQWWVFFSQIVRGVPVGNKPGSDLLVVLIWLIFGVGVPVFFLWLHMVVEVVPEAVIVRYRPFVNRRIAINQITRVEPRVYRPLGEFGGWGIRGWIRRSCCSRSTRMSTPTSRGCCGSRGCRTRPCWPRTSRG